MNKSKVRGIIILAIVLVAYLVLALVIPFKHTATFWIGFVFGIIGLLVSVIGCTVAFKGAESAKSKFYGFPIARLVLIYAIVQTIVSFIFMAIAFICPPWICIIVSVILLVLAILGLVATDAVRDEIERQDVKIKTDVVSIRNLQSKTAFIVGQCDDEEAKKALSKLADSFKYSDPVSSPALADIEADLTSYVDELQSAVTDKDFGCVSTLCTKIESTLAERNSLCKLNK